MSLAKAVVVGVGAEDGLGAAISRCYAANDRHILVAGRRLEKVEKVAATIRRNGGRASAYAIDTTQEEDVIRLFDAAMTDDEDGGPADLVTYNAGKKLKIDFRLMDASTFEDFWRMNTLGGFWWAVKRRGASCRSVAAPSSSPGPRDRFGACLVLPISPRARRLCA
jgi:NAD(P)-dependent dehydrogenase (short-subunit alcohol dehydrogenase family)